MSQRKVKKKTENETTSQPTLMPEAELKTLIAAQQGRFFFQPFGSTQMYELKSTEV